MASAGRLGDFSTLNWLDRSGCDWTARALATRICYDRIDTMKWIADRTAECPREYQVIRLAHAAAKGEM